MGYIKGESRTQSSLFPVSLDELVPEDHVCRVIEAFVERLELPALGFSKAVTQDTGRPPYDPADLLKLYIYGYLHQTRTSRRLEKETHRNVEVMWLLQRLQPDHKTISRFRQENGQAIRQSCASFVQFCRQAGLTSGEWVAVDGSKFQAVASRKAVWTAKRLAKEQARVEQEIEAYLVRLDELDAEDESPSADTEALQKALALLQDTRSVQDCMQAFMTQEKRSQVIHHELDARLMKGCGPSYNVQSAVDEQHHLIVHHDVTDEASDNRSLQPMAEKVKDVLDAESLNILADAGYANGEQVAKLEQQDITPYVASNRAVNNQGDGHYYPASAFAYDADTDTLACPAGKGLHRKQVQRSQNQIIYTAQEQDCRHCALKSRCTERKRRLVSRHVYEEALQRMADRTTDNHMKRRGSLVEHPFGTLKYQIFGTPRFLLRGMWGAGTEMALGVLAYNLKRTMNVLGSAELRKRLIGIA